LSSSLGLKLDQPPPPPTLPLPPHIPLPLLLLLLHSYDYFLARRNSHLCGEAGKLIAQMLTDVQKELVPIVSASSPKEATVAYV
jgi:hypothetical protein